MTAYTITPDEAKFTELILYVAKRCKGDTTFGAVKLNKILFHAEFEAYRDLGRPITGTPFQNLEFGPAPRRLIPVQEKLLELGHARLAEEPTPAGVQKRLIALREPELKNFTQDELDLIDRVIQRLGRKNGSESRDDSHEHPGWIATSQGETIPYHMAMLSRPEPTEADRRYVKELIERGALRD